MTDKLTELLDKGVYPTVEGLAWIFAALVVLIAAVNILF